MSSPLPDPARRACAGRNWDGVEGICPQLMNAHVHDGYRPIKWYQNTRPEWEWQRGWTAGALIRPVVELLVR